MPIVALGDHNVEVIKMPGERALTFFGGTFDDEVLAAEIPVLVDIWADGGETRRRIAPLIEVMATEYTGIAKVGKLNAMSNTATAMKYNIRSVPTVLVFKGSKEGNC